MLKFDNVLTTVGWTSGGNVLADYGTQTVFDLPFWLKLLSNLFSNHLKFVEMEYKFYAICAIEHRIHLESSLTTLSVRIDNWRKSYDTNLPSIKICKITYCIRRAKNTTLPKFGCLYDAAVKQKWSNTSSYSCQQERHKYITSSTSSGKHLCKHSD